MTGKKEINRRISKLAWGALLVWWGVAIFVDPITLGMAAIGTGLIILGANAARVLIGLRPYINNYFFGAIAITWGILDQARMLLALPAAASFALLLVIFGLAEWAATLLPSAEQES